LDPGENVEEPLPLVVGAGCEAFMACPPVALQAKLHPDAPCLGLGGGGLVGWAADAEDLGLLA